MSDVLRPRISRSASGTKGEHQQSRGSGILGKDGGQVDVSPFLRGPSCIRGFERNGFHFSRSSALSQSPCATPWSSPPWSSAVTMHDLVHALGACSLRVLLMCALNVRSHLSSRCAPTSLPRALAVHTVTSAPPLRRPPPLVDLPKVGASFGRARELAFLHVDGRNLTYFPQTNGVRDPADDPKPQGLDSLRRLETNLDVQGLPSA